MKELCLSYDNRYQPVIFYQSVLCECTGLNIRSEPKLDDNIITELSHGSILYLDKQSPLVEYDDFIFRKVKYKVCKCKKKYKEGWAAQIRKNAYYDKNKGNIIKWNTNNPEKDRRSILLLYYI